MKLLGVSSPIYKWRQAQHNPHVSTRSLNRQKHSQVSVSVGGESFPYCMPYVDIVGVKFKPVKYRVTTTDNGGNTEIRDLPGLELVRFIRNARQDLWQCQYSHSLQELGTTWWGQSILETVDAPQKYISTGKCASKGSNCWELTRGP